jgi:hypothetical protein
MALQAMAHHETVLGFDIRSSVSCPPEHGIDPALSVEGDARTIEEIRRIEPLLHRASVVHWCAPSSQLAHVEALHPDRLVLLHDSVMATSVEHAAGAQQKGLGTFAVVHCLMNSHAKVVIASDVGEPDAAEEHIRSLGLSPVRMTSAEHDHMMARSQAVLSVLVKTILPDLVQYEAQGLLTQSAHELLRSLQHRESRWTPATMATMLANPKLGALLDELGAYIAEQQQP